MSLGEFTCTKDQSSILCKDEASSMLTYFSFSFFSVTKDGRFILTASNDGSIFVVDARASENFETLGFVCEFIANELRS